MIKQDGLVFLRSLAYFLHACSTGNINMFCLIQYRQYQLKITLPMVFCLQKLGLKFWLIRPKRFASQVADIFVNRHLNSFTNKIQSL